VDGPNFSIEASPSMTQQQLHLRSGHTSLFSNASMTSRRHLSDVSSTAGNPNRSSGGNASSLYSQNFSNNYSLNSSSWLFTNRTSPSSPPGSTSSLTPNSPIAAAPNNMSTPIGFRGSQSMSSLLTPPSPSSGNISSLLLDNNSSLLLNSSLRTRSDLQSGRGSTGMKHMPRTRRFQPTTLGTSACNEEPIIDTASLDRYLEDYEEQESKIEHLKEARQKQQKQSSDSIWSPAVTSLLSPQQQPSASLIGAPYMPADDSTVIGAPSTSAVDDDVTKKFLELSKKPKRTFYSRRKFNSVHLNFFRALSLSLSFFGSNTSVEPYSQPLTRSVFNFSSFHSLFLSHSFRR